MDGWMDGWAGAEEDRLIKLPVGEGGRRGRGRDVKFLGIHGNRKRILEIEIGMERF